VLLALKLAIPLAVFAGATGIALLAGASGLGVAATFGSFGFAIALVVGLLRDPAPPPR
jgi:hypothetical protein